MLASGPPLWRRLAPACSDDGPSRLAMAPRSYTMAALYDEARPDGGRHASIQC